MSRRRRRAEVFNHPVYFNDREPPAHVAIEVFGAGERRHFRFACPSNHAVVARTVPTHSEVRRVEEFARQHAGCRR